ncbi:MAG TPA: hypothetical protein VNH11_13885 [Pirellulales bacterium]|nr:hypothetical protein [Pirellulales bacterium]
MIHCDEVFDILTRGPFPTGAPSDGIVESHLNHCDACRQLAEALRPAIELLQEAIGPEESGSLPCYGGAAEPWSGPSAASLKTKQAVATRRARQPEALPTAPGVWPWRSAARFAAAACVGLVLAGLLRQVVLQGAMARRGMPPAVAVAASWRLDTDARQWAQELSLGGPCRQPVAGLTLAAARPGQAAEDALQLACCLGCHAARGNSLLPAARLGGFVQACQACH